MRQMQPLMPRADLLLPYLERVDRERYYSNRGHLVQEYERRLSEHFNCGIVSVSSCTTGLTACLLAQGLPRSMDIVVPSWTFHATACAVLGAGFSPSFVDVNANTHCSVGESGIVVLPFGARTGVMSSIVDAAAAFDTVMPSGCLQVVSTHCTKVFGTGEGGFVLSTDLRMLERVRSVTNFGFTCDKAGAADDRDVNLIGLNAKMSEYHAAVGLAELDGWKEKRGRWLEVKARYEGLFADFDTPVSGEWATSQFPIVIDRPIGPVMQKLSASGVSTRRVWGRGVHHLKAYKNFPRTKLPVTEHLADHTLFLPMALDMTKEEQEFVAQKFEEAMR